MRKLIIMVKKIIMISFCIPLFLMAQQDTLTYNQTQDLEFAEKYKNTQAISSYTTKDDLTISIGDTLILGNALIDRKKHLFDDMFSYIVIGNTKGKRNKEFRYLPHNYSGDKVVIRSFFVSHERFKGYKLWPNRKRMPLCVSVFVKNPKDARSLFLYSRKTILDIEKALSSGEVVNYNAPLSREEAIKKIKKAKELMELDFISREEYEEIREKLSSIILEKEDLY